MDNRTVPRFLVFVSIFRYIPCDMPTLSDVNTQGDGKESPCAGFTPNALPKANGSDTGVSVKYVKDPAKKWYVLRVTYGRALKAYDIIQKDCQEAYIPMRHVVKESNGKKRRTMVPFLPGIVFIYTSDSYVNSLVKHPQHGSFINFYFNHFEKNSFGKNPPLTIGYDEMINFINLTSIDNKHICIVNRKQCRLKIGTKVRITDGQFKGIEGHLARAAGEQRVIVELSDLCMVATAYVPTAFIEPAD